MSTHIRLVSLTLANFKGVRAFTLKANGKNVETQGENATGKTTLFDGFYWLFFGKDSMGRSDFEVKTLDAAGQVIPGIDHSVAAVLEINGQLRSFVRTYREKYQKKRGAKEEVFSGNETVYLIDDVPMKEMEYQAAIAAIMPEMVFKLVTNARWFNENLTWQARRKTLLDICGDVEDVLVYQEEPGLADLPGILGTRNLADYRSMATTRKAEINRELTQIPIRVDEATKQMPNIESMPVNAKAKLEAAEKRKAELERQRADIEAGGELAAKTKEKREWETRLIETQNSARQEAAKEIEAVTDAMYREQDKYNEASGQLSRQEQVLRFQRESQGQVEEALAGLRRKWTETNAEEWAGRQAEACPACGKAYEPEELEAKREEARAKFNQAKSCVLEDIQAKGKAAATSLENIKLKIDEIESQKETSSANAAKADAETKRLAGVISDLRAKPPVTVNLSEITKTLERLEGEISLIKAGQSTKRDDVNLSIAEVAQEIAGYNAAISKAALVEDIRGRIDSLNDRKAELSKQYDTLERGIYLTELFIRTKVKLLEAHLNAKFKLVRFKLFDVQVNGAVVECCETTVGGVPYSSLNNGARINAGLDVINTLAEYYQVVAPVFVDNAEAVTKLMPTLGQQIRLYVAAGVAALSVRMEEA